MFEALTWFREHRFIQYCAFHIDAIRPCWVSAGILLDIALAVHVLHATPDLKPPQLCMPGSFLRLAAG